MWDIACKGGTSDPSLGTLCAAAVAKQGRPPLGGKGMNMNRQKLRRMFLHLGRLGSGRLFFGLVLVVASHGCVFTPIPGVGHDKSVGIDKNYTTTVDLHGQTHESTIRIQTDELCGALSRYGDDVLVDFGYPLLNMVDEQNADDVFTDEIPLVGLKNVFSPSGSQKNGPVCFDVRETTGALDHNFLLGAFAVRTVTAGETVELSHGEAVWKFQGPGYFFGFEEDSDPEELHFAYLNDQTSLAVFPDLGDEKTKDRLSIALRRLVWLRLAQLTLQADRVVTRALVKTIAQDLLSHVDVGQALPVGADVSGGRYRSWFVYRAAHANSDGPLGCHNAYLLEGEQGSDGSWVALPRTVENPFASASVRCTAPGKKAALKWLQENQSADQIQAMSEAMEATLRNTSHSMMNDLASHIATLFRGRHALSRTIHVDDLSRESLQQEVWVSALENLGWQPPSTHEPYPKPIDFYNHVFGKSHAQQ